MPSCKPTEWYIPVTPRLQFSIQTWLCSNTERQWGSWSCRGQSLGKHAQSSLEFAWLFVLHNICHMCLSPFSTLHHDRNSGVHSACSLGCTTRTSQWGGVNSVFPILQPERLRRTGTFTARMNNSGFSGTSRGVSIRSELVAGENKWLLTKVAGVCLQPHQARYSQHRRGLQGQRELGKLKISLYCLCVSAASYSQTLRASQVWHPSAQRRSWWWPSMSFLPALTSWQR